MCDSGEFEVLLFVVASHILCCEEQCEFDCNNYPTSSNCRQNRKHSLYNLGSVASCQKVLKWRRSAVGRVHTSCPSTLESVCLVMMGGG